MQSFDYEKISARLREFVKNRNWDQFHSPKNLSMALSVEASELVEIFQWMTEEDSLKVGEDLDKLEKVSQEVADIMTYLMLFCAKTGINLQTAVEKKIKMNEDKYPVGSANRW